MKNKLLKIAASLLMIIGYNQVFAQKWEPYFLVDEGAVREMASYDKKDKLTGTTIQTLKDGNITIKKAKNRSYLECRRTATRHWVRSILHDLPEGGQLVPSIAQSA